MMLPCTPMISPLPNLKVKLEIFNPAGSHKARAARHILRKAIEDGELKPGGPRRIIEKSGGNFGIGLAYEAAKHDIGVDLVVGLSFSSIKRRLCEEYGARLIGIDLLQQGLQPKEIVAHYLNQQGGEYFFTDQFANRENLNAHLRETAPEIAGQIRPDSSHFDGITLVLSAGTGAHVCALESTLGNEFPNLRVVVPEPENCSFREGIFGTHSQQGAAVGVTPPFLDLKKVNQFEPVSDLEAIEGQQQFARDCGIYPGPTSGANYFLAKRIAAREPHQLVVTMIYDAGDAYLTPRTTG